MSIFDDMGMNGEDAHYHETRLEKLKIGLESAISKEFFNEADLELVERAYLDQIVATYRSFVWSEPRETITKRTPSTWWQAFKLAHFPEWLKVRYPVKYDEFTLTITMIYPHVNFPTEDRHYNLVVQTDLKRNIE